MERGEQGVGWEILFVAFGLSFIGLSGLCLYYICLRPLINGNPAQDIYWDDSDDEEKGEDEDQDEEGAAGGGTAVRVGHSHLAFGRLYFPTSEIRSGPDRKRGHSRLHSYGVVAYCPFCSF